MHWRRDDDLNDKPKCTGGHDAPGALRWITAQVLYIAAFFCFLVSIPTIIMEVWIQPAAGGAPVEGIRLLIGLLGAGGLWLVTGLMCRRAPWYVIALLATAGLLVIHIGVGDR